MDHNPTMRRAAIGTAAGVVVLGVLTVLAVQRFQRRKSQIAVLTAHGWRGSRAGFSRRPRSAPLSGW